MIAGRRGLVGQCLIREKSRISDFKQAFLLEGSGIKNKRQVLRNCVDRDLGLHVFESARKSMDSQT